MYTTLQIVVGVLAVPLLALGARSMFMPVNMGDAVGLAPAGIPGRSEIRGALGGLFVATVMMIVAGIATDDTVWFLAAASIMGAAVLGRLVSIVADGFDRAVVPPIAVEVVIGGALVAAHLAGS